jgi:exodeoxyribonuclease VII small subunit
MGDVVAEQADFSGLGYDELKAELQEIVGRLSADEVSIDDVTVLVRRAQLLLGECRKRLRATKDDLESIVADLELDS